MGFWSSVTSFVESAKRIVKRVVTKVYEVVLGEKVTERYDRLGDIIENVLPLINSQNKGKAPDFYTEFNSTEIEKKISEQNQKLMAQSYELRESRRMIALQVDLARLRSSAELIDRSMENIKIHASSLSVHYQNMRNINGLIDQVNSLRHGLKAVISVINYNANLMGNEYGNIKKVEGIDLEKKRWGHISGGRI